MSPRKISLQTGPIALQPESEMSDLQQKAAALGITGTLPLQTGQTIVKNLDPDDMKDLAAFGIKEGDKIPGNMADIIYQAKQIAKSTPEKLPQIPADYKPPEFKVRQFADLNESERAYAMEIVRDVMQKHAESPQPTPVSGPGLGGIPSRIIQPKQEPPKQPETPLTARPMPQAASEPTQTPEKPISGLQPGAGAEPDDLCPYCQYDKKSSVKFTDPSVDDCRRFQMSAIAMKPFTKEYEFFEGKFKVRFRTLNLKEEDLCYQQMQCDKTQELVLDYVGMVEMLSRYRTYLSVLDLQVEGQPPIELPESIEGWEVQPGQIDAKNTKLKLVREYFETNVLFNKILHQEVLLAFGEFTMLVHRLMHMARMPNFSKGIS